jgi:hypothetical protein
MGIGYGLLLADGQPLEQAIFVDAAPITVVYALVPESVVPAHQLVRGTTDIDSPIVFLRR